MCVILLLKMTPKQGTKVLSGFSKCNKAVICLVEKIPVLDKLCLGVSYSPFGHEFKVSESVTCIK